jgi:hypothetical protein
LQRTEDIALRENRLCRHLSGQKTSSTFEFIYKIERNDPLFVKKRNVRTQKHKIAHFREIRTGELGNRTNLCQFCLGSTDMRGVYPCPLGQE